MAAFPAALNDLHTAVGSSGTPLSTGHVSNHAAVAADVEGLAAKVGIDASAVTTSHDYLIARLRAQIPGINQQTDDYTLALTDAGKTVEVSKGSGVTLTVPANGTIAFVIGTHIEVIQTGAGQLTIAAAGGVTINKTGLTLKALARWSVLQLYKQAADVWVLGPACELALT